MKGKSKFKSKLALFINSRGEAMQTHTYRNTFNNLKRFYLGMLKIQMGDMKILKSFVRQNGVHTSDVVPLPTFA